MTAAPEPGFNRAGVGVLVALGVVFAAAFVLLSAFGSDFKSGRDGGAHALSPAATGYAGIVSLAKAAGLSGKTAGLSDMVARDDRSAQRAGLLVLTPGPDAAADDVQKLLRLRRGAPVLLVLPKWLTMKQALHPGWVESTGELPPVVSAALGRGLLPTLVVTENAVSRGAVLHDNDGRGIAIPAPAGARTLANADGLDPVLIDSAGHMVMGWNAKNNLYVLADPDILSNKGMRDLAAARGAVQLLAAIGGDRSGGLVFDVTLNGFGAGRSLLRTAFEPPFVALTLALLIAGGLAFGYGLMRFGVPQSAPRAIAFGKLALVDNVASLIRMAKREAGVAPRYAALVAETVAARLRAPAGLDEAALAAWLEARVPGYAALAEAAAAARGRDESLAAAQALFHWQETIS